MFRVTSACDFQGNRSTGNSEILRFGNFNLGLNPSECVQLLYSKYKSSSNSSLSTLVSLGCSINVINGSLYIYVPLFRLNDITIFELGNIHAKSDIHMFFALLHYPE